MQELVTQYCWGDVWNRPGLDRRTRSLLNLAMLTALNRPHELKLHVKGALRNGVTKDEIREVFAADGDLLRRAGGDRQLSQRARSVQGHGRLMDAPLAARGLRRHRQDGARRWPHGCTRAGHPLRGARCARAERGAGALPIAHASVQVARTLGALADCDVVITMLPDSAAVEAVAARAT